MSVLTTGFGNDQAARLRDLVRRAAEIEPRPAPTANRIPQAAPRTSARLLAVASGKGGVGKTNLCANLAAALTRRGSRIVLLDGDLGLGNADVLCGVTPTGHLGDVLDGRRELGAITLAVPPGFRLIPGASGVARLAALDDAGHERLITALAPLEHDCDLILADCGAGIGPSVLAFLSAAELALIVATPEPTAITDAYAAIKCFAQRRTDAGARNPGTIMLVVNQAQSRDEGIDVHRRIAGAAARFLGFDLPLAGVIARDEAVRDAVRRRSLFIEREPKCPASCDVRALSARVHELLSLASPAHASSSANHGAIARLLRFMRARSAP